MMPRLKDAEVRSGFLGTVDAAIKYFDPNQYTPTASAKERLDKENETAKLEAERLRKELEDLRELLNESEFNRRQVESDYAFVEEKISKHTKEKLELQRELYTLREQLQAKDFELKEALDELALLKRDIVNAEVASKRVEGRMATTGSSFFPTSKSRDHLLRAMESTEIEHEKAIAKLSELQQELQQKNAMIEALNLRLADEANERKRIVSHTKMLLDERMQRITAPTNVKQSTANSKVGSRPGSKTGSKPPSNS